MKRKGALALSALIALSVPMTAHADPQDPLDRFERTDSGSINSQFVPGAADDQTQVTVMVELAKDPVAVVEAKNRGQLKKAQKDAVMAAISRMDRYFFIVVNLFGNVTS